MFFYKQNEYHIRKRSITSLPKENVVLERKTRTRIGQTLILITVSLQVKISTHYSLTTVLQKVMKNNIINEAVDVPHEKFRDGENFPFYPSRKLKFTMQPVIGILFPTIYAISQQTQNRVSYVCL